MKQLPKHENELVRKILERLDQGRRDYGAWTADDPRDFRREAFEEFLDAALYCAAKLLQIERDEHDQNISKSDT